MYKRQVELDIDGGVFTELESASSSLLASTRLRILDFPCRDEQVVSICIYLPLELRVPRDRHDYRQRQNPRLPLCDANEPDPSHHDGAS